MNDKHNNSLHMTLSLTFVLTLFALFGIQPVGAAGSPTIGTITSNDTGVGIELYHKWEASFPVTTSATNLYLPYEANKPTYQANLQTNEDATKGISVDALLLPPGQTDWSQALVQPCFFMQTFQAGTPNTQYDNDLWAYQDGGDGWKCRFAPTHPGTWQYKIRAMDATGTTYSGVGTFTCMPSTNHGFLHVSAADTRYFQFDDGTTPNFVGIGIPMGNQVAGMAGPALQQIGATGAHALCRLWIGGHGGVGTNGQDSDEGLGRYINAQDNGFVGRFATPTCGLISDPAVPPHSGRYCWFLSPTASLNVNRFGLVPNQAYAIKIWIKPINVAGANPQIEIRTTTAPGQGTITGDTPIALDGSGSGGWQQFSLVIPAENPNGGSTPYMRDIRVSLKNITGGKVYVDDLSVTDAAGCDVLCGRGDAEFHAHPDQQAFASLDSLMQTAEQQGQYFLLSVFDKQDVEYRTMTPDASAGMENPDDSFFHGQSPVADTDLFPRRMQRYFLRYLMAREGYSTSAALFELCNEGAPFGYPKSSYHAADAQWMGEVIHSFTAEGKRPSSTSTYQTGGNTSFDPTLFENPAYPDIDFGGPHYYPHGVGFGGSWLPYNNQGDQINVGHLFRKATGGPLPGYGALESYGPWVQQGIAANKAAGGTGSAEGENTIWLPQLQGGGQWTLSFQMKCSADATWNTDTFNGASKSYLAMWVNNQFITCGPGASDNISDGQWHTFSTTVTLSPAVQPQCFIRPRTHALLTGTCDISDIRLIAPDGKMFFHYTAGEPTFDGDTASQAALLAGNWVSLSGDASVGKPLVIGETDVDRFSSFNTATDNPDHRDLAMDVSGMWFRHFAWGHIGAGAAIQCLWNPRNSLSGGFWKYAAAYQNFLAGIPLTNGHYRDIDASVSTPNLLVLGQKDTTAKRAHLWVRNAAYNALNVVNATPVISVGGTISFSGFAANGAYTVDTWDTSRGVPTNSQVVTADANGGVSLSVDPLAGDIAFKVYPALAPILSVTLTVDKTVVKPGDIVKYTLSYTNKGSADAQNVVLPWPLPAQTTFVSADTSGIYNAAKNEVDWSLGTVAAGQSGTVTLSVRVN